MSQATKEYLYGLNPIFEVLRANRRRVFRAYINQSMAEAARIRKLAQLLEERQVPVEWVDKQRVFQLAESKEHQGVVLHAALYPYVPSAELFTARKLLLLDNVEDPHNVGAVLRSADIFGFHEVLLPQKGTPDIYPSVLKVSAGAAEFLRIAKDSSANDYARRAREAGYKIAILDARGNITPDALAANPPEKLLLVVGGEDKGVGQFIVNMADHILSIPQRGRINSLNASVAAGIAMYALADI